MTATTPMPRWRHSLDRGSEFYKLSSTEYGRGRRPALRQQSSHAAVLDDIRGPPCRPGWPRCCYEVGKEVTRDHQQLPGDLTMPPGAAVVQEHMVETHLAGR